VAYLRTALAEALGPGYHVEREVRPVGEHRMFVARETRTGSELVVKVLPAALSLALDATAFEREVHPLADRLRHPNLVAASGAGRAGQYIYHVRPFVAGTTLRAWVTNHGAVPLTRAVDILRAVLAGLAHAHAANIAHGDLKPEHVLLGQGRIVLADTGIAGATERARATPSPAPVGPADDLVAVGLLTHEMITGLPAPAGQEPLDQTRPLPHWLVEWMGTRWTDAGKALAALPPPPPLEPTPPSRR
jgi:serine/threonine-protein kinase